MNPVEQRAIEIEETIREIERELREPLDLGQRIAIGFALDRFAERIPPERDFQPW